jgi:ATP-dependent Lon protease
MEYSNNYNQANTPVVNDALEEGLMEVKALEAKLSSANLPEKLREETMIRVSRLKRMFKLGGYSAEFEAVSKYVDWITRIPWGVVSEDNLDIHRAKQVMDETHHGLETIKDLILDYIATMQLQSAGGVDKLRRDIIPSQVQYQNNQMNQEVQMGVLRSRSVNAPVFLFLGLQGVGKTSIAMSIARSMGRKFSRISLGAIGDVRTLRGAPRYSPDAEPGQIIKSLVRCGTMNPVILLDEIEKASGNKGLLSDIMAALLEILDPEQNSTFVDHYIDYPVDLSNVFFICTANNLGGLSAALLDRVEVIRFTSYSDQEKEVIGKEYILPRVLKSLNISPEYIRIEEEVWPLIIRPVGFDAGIRQLERNITTIVRSAARMIVEGKPLPIVINSSNLTDYVLADQGPLS